MSIKRTVLLSAVLWLAMIGSLRCALNLLLRQLEKFDEVEAMRIGKRHLSP